MSVHVRRESVLQRAAIRGGPAEEGAQLLTGVELESPALSSAIQVEASKAGQREPMAGAEGLVHLLQHAIQPPRGRGFVSSHPLSKAADKLLLLDTFGHSFPFTLYTSRASVYLSDPGNNARTRGLTFTPGRVRTSGAPSAARIGASWGPARSTPLPPE